MAFVSAIRAVENIGSLKFTYGTFLSSGGDAGGDIITGLVACEGMVLQHSGAAAVASAPSVNETLPVDGKAVTIVTVADTGGYWMAWGF